MKINKARWIDLQPFMQKSTRRIVHKYLAVDGPTRFRRSIALVDILLNGKVPTLVVSS